MVKKSCIKWIVAAVCAVGMMFAAQPALAQRGEKALGLKGGFSTKNDGGVAAVYFHYTLHKHIRLAPEIGYMFRNNGMSGFECCVDVHFPFRMARGFNIYPLMGVTLNNWDWQSDSATRFGFDIGGGVDIYMTTNLKLTLQGKYSMMNDFGGGFFDAGIAYVF